MERRNTKSHAARSSLVTLVLISDNFQIGVCRPFPCLLSQLNMEEKWSISQYVIIFSKVNVHSYVWSIRQRSVSYVCN